MASNVSKRTKFGGIEVSLPAIASVAANAVKECYGVIGLSGRSNLRDNIYELLQVEEYNKGVYVKKTGKGYVVDLYIVCAFGVKIPEVISEVQKKIKYTLEQTFRVKFSAVNVYVQDIKSI